MSQIATASITLKLDMRNFDKEFSQIKGAVSQLGSNLKNVGKNLQLDTTSFRAKLKNLSKDIQKVGQRAKDVGQNLSIGLTAPIVLMGASILKTAGNFEEAMNTFSANSQLTEKDIKHFTEMAKKMGIETVFSATQSAKAMNMLGKNGLDTNQIDKSLESVLNLSVALESNMSLSADVATDAMTNFGLKASDMPSIVSNITGTVLKAKLELGSYANFMSQAGSVAKTVGISLADFNTTLAAIIPSFSGGGDAGTAFKTALIQLAKPTSAAQKEMNKLGLNLFDASGKMRPMAQVAGQLSQAFSTLNAKQKVQSATTLAGTDGFRALIKLSEVGAEGFNKLAENIAKVNILEVVAKKAAGFNFALKSMGSAFEGVQLAIANSGFLEFATSFVNKITGMLRGIANLNPQILKIGTVIAGLAAAVGPLLIGFGILSTTVLPALVAGFGLLFSPITLVVAAVAGAAYLIISNWESISEFFSKGAGSDIFGKVKEIAIKTLNAIGDFINYFVDGAKAKWAIYGDIITDITKNTFKIITSTIGIALDAIIGIVDIFTHIFSGDFDKVLDDILHFFASTFQNISTIVFSIFDSVLGGIEGFSRAILKASGGASQMIIDMTEGIAEFRTETEKTGKTIDDNMAAMLKKGEEVINQNNEVVKTVTKWGDVVADLFETTNKGSLKLNIDAGNLAPVEIEIIPKLAKFETAFDTGNLPDFGGETDFDFKANFDVDAIREVAAELEIATNKGLLFGDSFNVITEQQAILKNEMIALLNKGILPQDPAVQQLKEKYEALGTSLDIPNEGLKKIAGSMINMAAAAIQSGESFAVAAHKIISALISQGITAIISNTLRGPTGKLGLIGVAVAGAAGVAASALFKKAIPKFANGGIVSGRTLAEVGEYAGAAHNPEVIAPLDKLKSILGETGGNGNFNDSGIIGAIQSMPGTTVNIDRDGFDIFNHENLARTRYLNKRKSWNSN